MEGVETKPEGAAEQPQDEHEPLLLEGEGDTAKSPDTEPQPTSESDDAEKEGVEELLALRLPKPETTRKPPAWFPAKLVPKMRFPAGIDLIFLRIRGTVTARKGKGDRYLILWELSDGDEKLAHQRCGGDGTRVAAELAKQMVRAIDGHLVTWDGVGEGDPDLLWNEIGAKGRNQLTRLYNQLHIFDAAEQKDFFENCVALVRTG